MAAIQRAILPLLMVVFVLQTVVLPALLLWIMWAWARSLFEPARP